MASRTLTRNERGQIKWRLEDMAVGDTLEVPHALTSYGQAYNYAKMRSSTLGINLTIDRIPTGSLIRRTAKAERASSRSEWKRPTPSGTPCDWGVIRKTIGQKNWRWPFDAMEVGDEFRVASEDLPANDLRKRVYNYNWINQTHIAVEDSPITAPGYTLVRRNAAPRVQHDKTVWSVVQARCLECYESDEKRYAVDYPWDKRFKLDHIPWETLVEANDRVVVPARKIATPHRSSYIFEIPSPIDGETGRFALDLYEDQVVVERVEMDMTHELWDQIKQARIDEALD